MENKTELYKAIIDIYGKDGLSLNTIKTVETKEFVLSGYYDKYFKIKQIKGVKLRENDPNAIDIVFEGYIDKEAIERDKKKAEEDVLVEKITKAVLEKLEERDKKTVNIEGVEFPKELLDRANKIVNDAIKNLMERPY